MVGELRSPMSAVYAILSDKLRGVGACRAQWDDVGTAYLHRAYLS